MRIASLSWAPLPFPLPSLCVAVPAAVSTLPGQPGTLQTAAFPRVEDHPRPCHVP